MCKALSSCKKKRDGIINNQLFFPCKTEILWVLDKWIKKKFDFSFYLERLPPNKQPVAGTLFLDLEFSSWKKKSRNYSEELKIIVVQQKNCQRLTATTYNLLFFVKCPNLLNDFSKHSCDTNISWTTSYVSSTTDFKFYFLNTKYNNSLATCAMPVTL